MRVSLSKQSGDDGDRGRRESVDWVSEEKFLAPKELRLRRLAERMHQMTSLFVKDDVDLEIFGLSYDYDDYGMRAYTLNTAEAKITGSAGAAEKRWAATAAEMTTALEENEAERREIVRELPATMSAVFSEWAPGSESVLLRWDTDSISDGDVYDYWPHARVSGYGTKSGDTVMLNGEANDYIDLPTYRAESLVKPREVV